MVHTCQKPCRLHTDLLSLSLSLPLSVSVSTPSPSYFRLNPSISCLSIAIDYHLHPPFSPVHISWGSHSPSHPNFPPYNSSLYPVLQLKKVPPLQPQRCLPEKHVGLPQTFSTSSIFIDTIPQSCPIAP